MSIHHTNIEELIKNLENTGPDHAFFVFLDDTVKVNFRIRDTLYNQLAIALNLPSVIPDHNNITKVKLAYIQANQDLKTKLFNNLIAYLKNTYLNFKKEKIVLMDKKKLKEAMKYNENLNSIYGDTSYRLKIIKDTYGYSERGVINSFVITDILTENDLKIDIHIDTKEDFVSIDINGVLNIYEEENCKNKFKFIIDTFEEINKKNPYIEFVYDDE